MQNYADWQFAMWFVTWGIEEHKVTIVVISVFCLLYFSVDVASFQLSDYVKKLLD